MVGSFNPVWAADIGRLFTTPEQRQALQLLRLPSDGIGTIMEKNSASHSVAVITLNGVVYRPDGRHAVWINDYDPFSEGLPFHDIVIKQDGIKPDQVELILPDKSVRRLKVGEAFDPRSE